jgi:hypothetical protein
MRLPEREGDWQIIIGTLMLICSIVLVLIAEAKHRQSLEMLKEVKAIKQAIREECR